MAGSTVAADFEQSEPAWRAIQLKKDVPTVVATYNSLGQVPSGYDSAGNRLDNGTDSLRYDQGGRFTISSPTDQEVYVFIPRGGFKNYILDVLPVRFETIEIGRVVSGELARSQQVSYRFRALAGTILRTAAGPGRSGFQTTLRAVKLDKPNADSELNILPGLSKNQNTGTVFIRESGEYEVVIGHTGIRSQPYDISVADFSRPWTVDQSAETLPIGENLYYRLELPLGVLLDLTSSSSVFDLNFSLLDPWGSSIADRDDDGDSPNPRFQMLVTRPGSYFLRVGSYGNGGGGDFTLEKQLTYPTRYVSGNSFEVTPQRPALRVRSSKKGEFFYLAVSSSAPSNLEFYNPDGKPLGVSQVTEPTGRRIYLVNPQMDGDILMTFSTRDFACRITAVDVAIGG